MPPLFTLLRSLVGIAMVAACGVGLAAQARSAAADASNARPWTPSRTPDGQPDLQGVWSDLSITPLERPAALQGRASLTDQELAALKTRLQRLLSDPASDFIPGDSLFLALFAGADVVTNPNATGSVFNMVWREVDDRTSLIVDPPDGRLPTLLPDGRRRIAANQRAMQATPWQFGREAGPTVEHPRPEGPADLGNLMRCISWGVPKINGNVNYTSHYQIVQGPDHVVLLSEVNHEARVIPLDGRPHLSRDIRQVNGDSRGRWEGETLVVETTNFSPGSYFMGAADGLHLVERFTRTGADTMDYRLTLDDPTTWARPWTALVRLRASADQLHEFACHEGNSHVVRGILGGARAEEAGSGR